MWYMRHDVIRRFSDLQARLITPHLTANAISVARILMTGVMLAAFLQGALLAGGIIFLAATYLDFLDGAVARYQEILIREGRLPRYREARWGPLGRYGESVTGAWLDPLADKILVHAAIFALGWDILPHTLLWSGAALACLLTLARPLKAALGFGSGRANGFGKMKIWAQSGLVLVLLIGIDAAALPIQCTALGLAGLSLVWHFLPTKK